MQCHCCYRLVPSGTVIHDMFDETKKTLVSYPELIIPGSLDNEQFGNIYNPYTYERDNYQMCESALLADKLYMFVLDWNNCQYDCYTIDGRVEFRQVPDYAPYMTVEKLVLNIDDYAPCGVEVTEYSQLRFSSGSIFRIAYANGVIHTAKGRFRLSESMCNRLRKWRPDYKLYKIIRDTDEYFGYLFLDTGYGLLSVTPEGELAIREVPYGIEI